MEPGQAHLEEDQPSGRTPYLFIGNEGDARLALEAISEHPILGVDTETTGLDPYQSKVRLIQIATPERSYVFDVSTCNIASNPQFRSILESPRPIKAFHNAKFDWKMLRRNFGIEVRGIFDSLLASQLVAGGRGDLSHGLSAVSERYLGTPIDKTWQTSDWSGPLSDAQIEYAATDAAIMLPLREKLVREIEELKLIEAAILEFEAIPAIASMELAGVTVDAEAWTQLVNTVEKAHEVLSSELKRELAAGIKQLSLFGEPDINLDSPAQVMDALHSMGIGVEGTRSFQLQPLAREFPAVARLLEYRSVQKALTSYGMGLLERINPVTQRIHADFHQIGAAGGRMSCSYPNLQQVPNTPEYRSCFRAPAGRKLIIADYSQIELRILADWSQDTALVKALVSGEDLHCVTASQMLGIPLDQVSKTERAAAKQLNYGIMYGLGAPGLAARIECSPEEAEELIRKYFNTYSGVAEWLRDAAERAVRDRHSRTRSGRLINFTFDPEDRAQVAATQRFGKNSPIQGSSADIIKRAMARLYSALKSFDAAVINCIHDEVVVEVEDWQAEACGLVVEQEMVEAARQFIRSVPVSVDTCINDFWIK